VSDRGEVTSPAEGGREDVALAGGRHGHAELIRPWRTIRSVAEALGSHEPLRDVVIIWAASRAFFLGTGALGHAFLSPALRAPPYGVLSYWAHFDGAYYAHIAEHGYDTPFLTVFFPLDPLAIRAAIELGFAAPLAGVLVATSACLAALYFTYELGAHWWDARVARAGTLVLALFPTAFYLNGAYSESLFLAVSTGSLWALYVRGDLLMAGVFGCLAAATRNVGVLLVIPLASEFLRPSQSRWDRWKGIGILGPPLGLAAYVLYLWHVNYRPLEFVIAERAWERQLTNPLITIKQAGEQADDGLFVLFHPGAVFNTTSPFAPGALSQTINFGCLVLILALLVLAFIRLPVPVALYSLGVGLAPLLVPARGVPLLSLSRFMLALFPLYLVLGMLLASSRLRLAAWLACSVTLASYLTLEFVTWRWVA
jgi:hypothetical protein